MNEPSEAALALAKDICAAPGNEAIPAEARYRLAALEIDRVLADLRADLEHTREQVVFCFSEDEVPVFIQGYAKGCHEITDVCTAAQVNHIVANLVLKKRALERCIRILEILLDRPGDYAIAAALAEAKNAL